MKDNKNNNTNNNMRIYIIVPIALFLLASVYLCTGQSILVGIGNGSCIHDDLAVSVFDTGRYISMISIVITMILTIIFRNKSNKFFTIFIVISCLFVFVIPYGFVHKSADMRNNDICKGGLWDSKYCQMKMENVSCMLIRLLIQ